jgi:hypothetical protein
MVLLFLRQILLFIAITDVSRLQFDVINRRLFFDRFIDALLLSLLTIFGCHLWGKDNVCECGKLFCIIIFKRWQAFLEELYNLFIFLELTEQFVDIVSALIRVSGLDVSTQDRKDLCLFSNSFGLELVPVAEHERRQFIKLTVAPVSILR